MGHLHLAARSPALRRLASGVRQIAQKLGFDVVRHTQFPADFDAETADIIGRVTPYTKTTPERLFALCEAIRYLERYKVPGAIVECGVWRGGSMMAAAHTLRLARSESRDLYLFDTFAGMPAPGHRDVRFDGTRARQLLTESDPRDDQSTWSAVTVDEVRRAMRSTGYDDAKIHYVVGRVEDTIPREAPDQIALLRLDTDWYDSTKHELKHLFPRLSRGGVLLIDDYGWWLGARQAVDEYLAENHVPVLLNRMGMGRICVVYDKGLAERGHNGAV